MMGSWLMIWCEVRLSVYLSDKPVCGCDCVLLSQLRVVGDLVSQPASQYVGLTICTRGLMNTLNATRA